jgi:hypothetical protein
MLYYNYGAAGNALRLYIGSNWRNLLSENDIEIPNPPAPRQDNTLRWDATARKWVASAFLFNNNSSVGIGTTTPSTHSALTEFRVFRLLRLQLLLKPAGHTSTTMP